MDVEKVHEALSAALIDRDAARQMCQEVRAMLAQSEALRKADPDRKVDSQKMMCIEHMLSISVQHFLYD